MQNTVVFTRGCAAGVAMLAMLAAAPAIAQQPPSPPEQRQPPRLDLAALEHGPSAFPFFWRPYRQQPLPPVNNRNSPDLSTRIVGGKLPLSLHDFLHLVIENNLDIEAARYSAAIGQVDVLRAQSGQAARGTSDAPLPGSLFAGAIGAGVSSAAGLSGGGTGGAAIASQGRAYVLGPRGNFDPQLAVNVSYDHVVSPLNTKVVAGAAEVTVPSTVMLSRYQQALPWGTSFAVSFNLQRQVSTQSGLLFNPALTSFFAAQVYQPLLSGFGLAFNQRFVTVAKNNRQIVVESFRNALTTTLSNAANAYWDLIALLENVRVAQQAVSAAQEQLADSRQREQIGTMTTLDVLSAESQLASSRVQLVSAQTRVQQQEVTLKNLISRSGDPTLDAASIEPIDHLPGADDITMPSLADSVTKALTSRSVVKQAELGMQNQHVATAFTRKAMLPTLSVFAAYQGYSLGAQTSPVLRELWQASFPEYAVGFTFAVPVFNRAAQADDVRARLESEEAEANLQRTKNQVAIQARTAVVSLSRGRAQVEAAARAVEANRAAYAGEQDRLRAGTSTPYQVAVAARQLTAAESAEVQARVNYAKALVAHELAVGGLLQANGIDVAEALHGTLLKGDPTR